MRIDVKALLEAGVHFGHRTDKWNPKMKEFIFGERNGIYIIDLIKTAEQIEKACQFLKSIAAQGGKILMVGCKKQCKEVIKDLAQKNGSFYVIERWLGGTLTNLNTIRKSVARMNQIDDIVKSGKINEMPKQEAAALNREGQKLHRNLDGIRDMDKPTAAMIVIDPAREDIAVREARKLKIPVVAINDTNSDPHTVDYPVPANDDSIRSIKIIMEYFHAAIIEGKTEGNKRGGKPKDNSEKTEMNAVSA